MSSLAKAIAGLRSGRSVRIGDASFIAVETAGPAFPASQSQLLLSGRRAAQLKLGNRLEAADPDQPVAIASSDWLDGVAALALADPGQDLARAPLGPLQPVTLPDPEAARAAVELARRSGLLPALWIVGIDNGDVLSLDPGDVLAAPAELSIVARATLPLDELPPSQIVVFRSGADGQEHVALLVGAFGGKPPMVRLHSECLTGDVFGSLKCDCGPQLREALRIIGSEGGGILLYLRQEGRGIGIANKIRAYALQDRGLDTVDANERLGFADDSRAYGEAAAMLRLLGAGQVRLLTNNPGKVEALAEAGIEVVERIAHQLPANPHNADYLATKRDRSGHLL